MAIALILFVDGGDVRVIFPCRRGVGGPKMCSARRMSSAVRPLFSMRLLVTIEMKDEVGGHPRVACSERAQRAPSI